MSACQRVRDRINADAKLMAMDSNDEGTLPCIEVAGVQVYVYLHKDGALRVAMHFDTAENDETPGWGPNTPIKLDVGGTIVYAVDRHGDIEVTE